MFQKTGSMRNSSTKPKRCVAFERSENYAVNKILVQSVFKKKKSGIDGEIDATWPRNLVK